MTQQQMTSATDDMRRMFDPRDRTETFRNWAAMNQRLTQDMVDAALRTTDIVHDATHETLQNLREAVQVRDEPAEYGRAYGDFLRKQMDLSARATRHFAGIGQQLGADAGEHASEAGHRMAETAGKRMERASDDAVDLARDAALAGEKMTDRAADAATEGADKGMPGSSAKGG